MIDFIIGCGFLITTIAVAWFIPLAIGYVVISSIIGIWKSRNE